MPLFHQHKVLFIHIPKNAGRSIEEAFLGDAGTPDDGRRNLASRAGTWLQRRFSSPFAKKFLIGTVDYSLASQHLTYTEMQHLRLVKDDIFAHYRSFCVCRNPFDRAVSTVLHFASADGVAAPTNTSEFERLLTAWNERDKSDHNLIAHDRSQADYVLDSRGRMAVETILRFEHLEEDFEKFATSIGASDLKLTWFG
ncbi:MAG: sulfotransferase family 2 domain-containing protein, partial [Pseudomonadota bacterium]